MELSAHPSRFPLNTSFSLFWVSFSVPFLIPVFSQGNEYIRTDVVTLGMRNHTRKCSWTWKAGRNSQGWSIGTLPTTNILGSLSKRTFQGDAVMKSEKARDSRRRSRAKFNLLSTGATRLRVLHSQILACLILLGLLWYVLTSFVRFFFSYYNASLISDEDYIILYELLSSRIQILVRKAIVSTWMKWMTMNARPNFDYFKKIISY